MTFNPNIPAPNDFLDNSQGQLLSNNKALDASFDIDHTLFSDTTPNNGMHQQVTLYQSRTPPPALTEPASMLYSQTTGTSPTSLTNLFFSCIQNNVQKDIQLTGPQTIASRGYATLPGGLIIQWGSDQAVANVVTVGFPVDFTHVFVAVSTPQDNSHSRGIAENSLTISGFKAETENTNTKIYWVALGS